MYSFALFTAASYAGLVKFDFAGDIDWEGIKFLDSVSVAFSRSSTVSLTAREDFSYTSSAETFFENQAGLTTTTSPFTPSKTTTTDGRISIASGTSRGSLRLLGRASTSRIISYPRYPKSPAHDAGNPSGISIELSLNNALSVSKGNSLSLEKLFRLVNAFLFISDFLFLHLQTKSGFIPIIEYRPRISPPVTDSKTKLSTDAFVSFNSSETGVSKSAAKRVKIIWLFFLL